MVRRIHSVKCHFYLSNDVLNPVGFCHLKMSDFVIE
jgi:hypothetical protein